MNEVGSAFVRIRPNMSHFKREAETGVRHTFKELAKVAGIAFGAERAFEFGKEIIGDAADVQRQLRAVRAEFGRFSKDIEEFADGPAADLGISDELAKTIAARFGIMFSNLGIGQEQAAKMTVGFEQLAGAISQIRNIDPASVMQNLPLAVAGNLRALKQLGIATDQNQLKIAAFKLGLTSTIKEGLTPAQRAMAIYAIATAKLPQFLAQASAHSDDLAVRQRRLAAQWDNIKDELGAGLLPTMEKLTGYLSDKLPGAVDESRKRFKQLHDIFFQVTDAIGGVKSAMAGLFAVFVLNKITTFLTGLVAEFVAAGAAIVTAAEVQMEVVEGTYLKTLSTMKLATIGFRATISTLLVSTGIGALVLGLGLAAGYIITHWDQTKAWFRTFLTYLRRAFDTTWEAIKQGGKGVAYALITPYAFAIEKILQIASHLPFVGKYAKTALNEIEQIVGDFKPDFSKVNQEWTEGGRQAGDAYVAALRGQIQAQIKTFGGTLPALSALLGKQVNDAASAAVIKKPNTAKVVKEETSDTNDALTALQAGLKRTIATNDAGIAKLRGQLETLNSDLRDAVTAQAQHIRDAVEEAKSNLGSIASTLADTISQVIDKPLQDAQNKLTAFNNRKAITDLRKSAYLPGGKQLSSDPKTAIRELENLRSHASALSRGAIDDFIQQYKAAYLTVQGDQAQVKKDAATRSITDLTDAFNRGQISLTTYKKRVLAILTRDHVSYKRAGALLGSAFANGFRDQVSGLFQQAGLIASGPQVKGTTGSAVQIVRPLEAIRDDQKQIAGIQKQIRDTHGKLQTRIAKASEQTAATLKKIDQVKLGPSAADVRQKNPGNDKKGADVLSGTKG